MTVGDRLRRRTWPLITSGVMMGTWAAYTFLWNPVVYHERLGPARRSVGHLSSGALHRLGRHRGYLLKRYRLHHLPGVLLVLAPLAILTYHFQLSESYPRAVPHPSAWPILGPVSILLGLLPLFALDALQRAPRGHAAGPDRPVLVPDGPLVAGAGRLGPPRGHDGAGSAVYGLLAAWKRQWSKGGWLFAAALLCQPLVVLLFPIVLALYPDARRRIGWIIRVVVPTAVILAIPTIESWNQTTYALVKQPTFPAVNHPTPLLFLSLVIGHLRPATGVAYIQSGTGHQFITGTLAKGGNIVDPGPGRLAAVAVAAVIGFWVWKRHPSEKFTLWLCAVVLGVWCVLEPVMTPYYAWPFLAFAMACAGSVAFVRLAVTFGAAMFVTIWTEHFFSPWVWWGPTVVMVGLALYCAAPVMGEQTAGDPAGRR